MVGRGRLEGWKAVSRLLELQCCARRVSALPTVLPDPQARAERHEHVARRAPHPSLPSLRAPCTPPHTTTTRPAPPRPAPPRPALPCPAPQIIEGLNIALMSWEEALESGKLSPAEPVPPSPEDYCTIMYTSGTTGEQWHGRRCKDVWQLLASGLAWAYPEL
jgi:hypothetical protein